MKEVEVEEKWAFFSIGIGPLFLSPTRQYILLLGTCLKNALHESDFYI